MKRNQNHKYITLLLMLIITFSFGTANAQKKTKAKEIITVTLKSIIVDENGNPIPNATITTNEGALTVNTASDGSFTIPAKSNSRVLVEAPGYEDEVLVARSNTFPNKIILSKSIFYSGIKDRVILPAGIEDSKRNIVGAVSSITGEEISTYPDIMLSNMLQGKLLGLRVSMNAGGLANNTSSLSVRGNHRGSNNSMITLVDGMERPIDDLLPEEIESIEVLKDATSKILYGARAANGILLITTKHGEKLKRIIKANVEYGYGKATRTPEYLDSYDYARLYNQAREHDGLAPLYSAADLEGYKNSSGPNDFRYPNVDFNNYFLRDFNNFRKASLAFSGGDEQTQYFFVAGYTGTDGLQTVGPKPDYNRLNIRGNLDLKINDMISGFIGLAGQFDMTSRGPIDHATTFKTIKNTRPNEYPLIIDASIVAPDSSGIPALGASFTNYNNLYGKLVYGGFAKDQNVNGQTNFGLKFDFSEFVKGLSAKSYFTFDNSFYGQESLNTVAATYGRRYYLNPDGTENMTLTQLLKTNTTDNITLSNTFNRLANGFISNLSYNRKFGSHALNLDLSNLYLRQQMTGKNQDTKTANYTFRGNYSFNNKYIFEGDLSYMGSSMFIGDNRYKLFYAGGFAWIISDEQFFKSIAGENFDYLKFKVSAGVLGYDVATAYRLYDNRWVDNSNFRFSNVNVVEQILYTVVGNPSLRWEKSRQINVGFEALALKRRLFVEANYFNDLSYDQIQMVNAFYTSLYGDLYPSENWNKVANSGVELEIRWTSKQVEGWGYSIGGNMLYSKNKVLNTDQINYPDEYLRATNRPTYAMFGYVSEGIFGKDVELQDHPTQTFGPYGNGDVAYKDLNNDGIINSLDRKMLGNSLPLVNLGIDLNLNYKGWGLYALVTSDLGVDAWLNNSYYWMSGEDKYSINALDSYDATNNPNGKYPALTTTSGSNNLKNSDLWMENSSFVRLKNVELSYTIYNKNTSAAAKTVKIYSRGTNLFLVSKIKNLDPEALNAGIDNYPILRNVTFGVSISF